MSKYFCANIPDLFSVNKQNLKQIVSISVQIIKISLHYLIRAKSKPMSKYFYANIWDFFSIHKQNQNKCQSISVQIFEISFYYTSKIKTKVKVFLCKYSRLLFTKWAKSKQMSKYFFANTADFFSPAVDYCKGWRSLTSSGKLDWF